MIRKLLATTALATIIATGASAQTTTAPSASGTAIFNRNTGVDLSTGANGYFAADSSGILASNLIGKPIYNGSEDNAETIGSVNDVLMTSDGMAQAIVIGVGGFLGIGEKEVAVDFSRVNWQDIGDERRLVIATTADELNAAPSFDRATIEAAGNVAVTGTAGSGMDQPNTATTPVAPTPDATTTQATTSDTTMVDVTTLSAADLIGAHVLDANGDDMGEVSDVLLSDDTKTVKAYVVDIGGFLGIGEKPVALAAEQLQVAKDANGSLSVHTSFTQEQLGDKPTYSKDAYLQNPDLVLVR